jgi:DNA segregation ATPase FtsK/SpoIIIE, S-DNA-T family
MITPARTIFPDRFKLFFKKSVTEISGIFLLILAVVFFISVWSYNPMDPSLNTSTGSTPQNILGIFGSFSADFFLQIFGLGSFLFFAALGMWSYHLIQNNRVSFLRLTCLVISLWGIGIFLAASPQFLNGKPLLKATSPLAQGPSVGGVVSYLLLFRLQKMLFNLDLLHLIKPVVFFIFMGSLGLYWYGMGLSFQQLKSFFKTIYDGFSWFVFWTGQKIGNNYKRPFVRNKSSVSEEDDTLNFFRSAALSTVVPASDDEQEVEETSLENHEQGYTDIDDTEEEEGFVSEIPVQRKTMQTKKEQFQVPDSIRFSGHYHLPPIDLLDVQKQKQTPTLTQEALANAAKDLENVLDEFGVKGEIVNVRPGPVVTMFELKPAPGIKTSRVIGLADDIARSMSALSTRIAVIPGQNVIGIELPNKNRQMVFMRDMLAAADFQQTKAALPLILGKDIGGQPIVADLTRMPHLLVAGTTGSGKSVSINTMILSLLFKFSPEQCKFIMIDPKMLELSVYDDIPHLLAPVVTDPKKAIVALKWAVREMENRYRAMSKLGVRNIDNFNARLKQAKESGEILIRRIQTGFDPDTGRPIFENQTLDFDVLPYIVVVVDEMADLMLVAGKEIEAAVQRLAQMARAAGIHLIMATQRPSVDVITGTIKANFPTRISFQVTSKIDSRTILGEQGAEQLLGQGDMLYMAGGGRISRVHGPFLTDTEVERIVHFLKSQGEPNYVEAVTEDDENQTFGEADSKGGGDDLYRQAVELVLREGKASTSFIQRHLQLGYNRAARLIEQMEKEGIVSAANHVGKREILGKR